MLETLIYGNYDLLKFFIKTLPLIREISKSEIGYEPNQTSNPLDKSKKIIVDNKIAEKCNEEFKVMKNILKQNHKGTETDFSTKMRNFFILRIICCVFAFFNYFYLTILISTLQFLLLPYSLIVSLSKLIEISYNIFLGYFIYFPFSYFLMTTSELIKTNKISLIFNYSWKINNEFILFFFLIDFLICCVFTFFTPRGKTKQFPLSRITQSIIFGFLNTKTYYLILLFLLRGAKIPIFLWLIDAFFQISENLISKIQNILKIKWPMVFYHQHRVAHFPHVYSDAHKFHHFLHDSSPFDAHLYGSGAPEEWHSLMLELVPSFFFGLMPPSLSFFALKNSLHNKIGHTRKENGNNQELNHVDHHCHHVKNYSWNISLEMFLGTSTNNNKMVCDGYVVTKEIEDDKAVFIFEPII